MDQGSSSSTTKPEMPQQGDEDAGPEAPRQRDEDIHWWKSHGFWTAVRVVVDHVALSTMIHSALSLAEPRIETGQVREGYPQKDNGEFHSKPHPVITFTVNGEKCAYALSRYPPKGAIHTPASAVFPSRKDIGEAIHKWLATKVVLDKEVQFKDCSPWTWNWKPLVSEILALMKIVGGTKGALNHKLIRAAVKSYNLIARCKFGFDIAFGMYRRQLYDTDNPFEKWSWQWVVELFVELLIRAVAAYICSFIPIPWLAGAASGFLQGMITIGWGWARKKVMKFSSWAGNKVRGFFSWLFVSYASVQ